MQANIIKEVIELLVSIVIALIAIRHFNGTTVPSFFKYRTFWPRFWGPSIDSVILWPLISLLPLLLGALLDTSLNVAWGMSLFIWTIQFGYIIYFNGRYGGTVGKLKCNLRILDHKTEQPITFKQAFLRDSIPVALALAFFVIYLSEPTEEKDARLILVLSGIYMLWFLAEILTMLTNSKRRALHDFIAGTVVVRTNIRKRHPFPKVVTTTVADTEAKNSHQSQ